MQHSATQLWEAAQQPLRKLLTQEIYNLWFVPIRPLAFDGEGLTLQVADEFCEVWLQENYLGLLQEVLSQVSGQPVRVRFQVGLSAPNPRAARSVAAEETAAPTIKLEAASEHRNHSPTDNAFNPRSTFETFVVGNNNTFSHAAAVAVAQQPGQSYNPLFLYGGTGLGKTHLLHAIGHFVVARKSGARVAYVTSEKFTNEFIDAIQNNQVVRFRKRYRQADVLLIDDVHFLAGKERIQEEFFHTFNALHENHRQIVLTSDRPAGEIQGLEQRLVSRFEWGLVTDLQPPDIETRLAILRKKEKIMGAHLPDEIINFLAQRIRSNVRRLEGALTRVVSYASLTGKKLTPEVLETLLRELLHEEGRLTITIESIQKRVSEHYDLRLADMTSKRRPENIAFPRQVAMYLSRHLTDSSLNTIGEAFGGRDHGTVLHACRQVRDRMQVDEHVRSAVHYLEQQLMR